jgi:hypothetical protein
MRATGIDVQEQRAYPLQQKLQQIQVVCGEWWFGNHQSISLEYRACPEVVHCGHLGLGAKSE